MKAIALIAPKQIEITNIPEPTPGPEDVLVEIHSVGLCGSDLNMYRGLFPLAKYPRVIGHEVSGIIIHKGPRVPGSVGLGDKVVLSPYSNCGICPACRAGRPNCCQYNETMGLQRDGAMTGRFALHYSNVIGHPDLSLRELVLTEPLSVGYHAANRGRVSETDTVLVVGCGTIGIGVIAAAACKGATIIAADIDDAKLATAARFGAETVINSARQDLSAVVSETTRGEGVNVAIEAVGLPLTFRQAVEAVCFAGRVVYVGYAKKDVTYDTTSFVRKELDILGSRNALRVFPAVIKMLAGRQFPFTDLISATYPFTQAATALSDWNQNPGRFTKILIDIQQ
jgi:threonine dehydrogenase-like Zn-dependent dehydrogenase